MVQTRLIPYVMGVSVLLQTLDATAIATALPAMAKSLGVDPVTASLAITAYLIGMALTVPAGGWLADRFGGRNVFRVATVILMLASLVSAWTPTFEVLVVARFVGGAASSIMVPIGRLMVIRSVPKAQMLAAVTTFATLGLVGPILGSVLGGLFVQWLSWRAVFLMIVPLGALVLVAITYFTENDQQNHSSALDVTGLILSGLGLAALVTGMEWLGHGANLPLSLGLLGTGVLLLSGLYVHARRVPQPLIRVELLRRRALCVSIGSDFATRMLISAGPLLASLLLQVGLNQSAVLTGFLLLTPVIGHLAMKPVLSWGARRVGLPKVMAWGGVLSGLAFAGLAGFGESTWAPAIFIPLALHGLGRSMVVSGGTLMNFEDVPAQDMGAVTGLISLFQQVAMVLGVGMASLFLRLCSDGALDLAAIQKVVLIMSGVSLLSVVALKAQAPRTASPG